MNIETLNLIIGAILPPFIQLLNQYVKNSNVRYVISIVTCLGVGSVSTYILGDLNATDMLKSAGVVFASASTTYKLFFDNTEVGLKMMAGK